jgi:RING-like zinc finger
MGNLKLADYSNASNLSSSDIALISCDPNGSNMEPSTVVGEAGDAKPVAILLYSQTARECNLTGQYNFTTMYTMTSLEASNALMAMIQLYPPATPPQAAISANATTTQQSSPSSAADANGPAPTTAVAMSILYSITGIITLLFLIIIATGAIRAHRHPERYGPRTGYAGRPRQSRAKGLARAMLETLPIVKFGDPEPVKSGSRDVELESGSNTVHHTPATPLPTVPEANEDEEAKTPTVVARAADSNVESGLGAAQAESIGSGQETAPREGELGCSICTEDFKTGEDVRVLPCNHKYHPACIDPWLLNVSGTCPLW